MSKATSGGVSRKSDSGWDERARSFGTDLRAVLFKSFPPPFNRFLHDWHVAELRRVTAGWPPSSALQVLDVGCGYGRLSREVRQEFPQARLTGIDISPQFARCYGEGTGGNAIVNDLAGLPLRQARFDLVLLVTTLMYLSHERQELLLTDCVRVMKPEGRLFLVEGSRRGAWIYSGFGLLPLIGRLAGALETSADTPGRSFDYPELDRLVTAAGGRIVRRSGAVLFTFLLPLLLALTKAGALRASEKLLRLCRSTTGTKRYSLHICYEVRKALPGDASGTLASAGRPGRESE